MDREAFKQRMQSLKSYREQNPGKGYLDWKTSLPDNLQDESSYNLQRAYELGYEPEYVEEDRSYHLPTRDQETGEILKKPWHPTFLIGLQEDAKLGYYPQTINGVTYTTTWEGNENPIYKYADGGEVPPTNKPTIIEPIPYKGKLYSDRYGRKYTEEQVYDYYNNGTDEIDRFTGGPLVRGLKPLLDLEDAANFTPVGDAVAAYDVYDAVSNRDWSGAGLAALGLVPFVPMTVKQFRSKYKGVTPKVKRQVPTVNRKAVDSQLDFEVEKKRRQNQYFSKAKNEGYEIVQRLTDDPEYLRRANQVKQQFGDDYITTYADLIQAYNEDPLKLPGIEFYNSTGKDKASMAATLESSNRFRNKQGPFPMLGEFNYRIDSSKTDLSGDVTLHEWNHLTDYMKNKAPLADGDSNMFYKMSKDISNKQIDNDYQYYSRPTEQKAYMNQVREYMFKNGMISKRGDNVDAKMLQNVLNSLSEIDSMKSAVRASKQFKNINKYTKWFNSIPLLGVGALGMYDYANTNE